MDEGGNYSKIHMMKKQGNNIHGNNIKIDTESGNFIIENADGSSENIFLPCDDLATLEWLASFLDEPLVENGTKPLFSRNINTGIEDNISKEQTLDVITSSNTISLSQGSTFLHADLGELHWLASFPDEPLLSSNLNIEMQDKPCEKHSDWITNLGTTSALKTSLYSSQIPTCLEECDGIEKNSCEEYGGIEDNPHEDQASDKVEIPIASTSLVFKDTSIQEIIVPRKARTKAPRVPIRDCNCNYEEFLTVSKTAKPTISINNTEASNHSEYFISKKAKLYVSENILETSHGIKRRVMECTHCGMQQTPLWRAGPLGPKTLCNACGIRYRSGGLLPQYRPVASPTFSNEKHSCFSKQVLEMKHRRELIDGKLLPKYKPASPSFSVDNAGVGNESKEFISDKAKVYAPKNISKTSHGMERKYCNKSQLRQCIHCSTQKTPYWRKGPSGLLCNACGTNYRRGRLLPEYRPAASPTFCVDKHSNLYKQVLKMRYQEQLAIQEDFKR